MDPAGIESGGVSAATPPQRFSPTVQGAAWMLASAAAFTLFGLFAKLSGDRLGPAQLAFCRVLMGAIAISPWILRAGASAWHAPRPGAVLMRSISSSLGFVLSLYAFSTLTLADANAITFSRTLIIVPLAYFLLKEPVGPRRWTAAALGFAGVLLMLQPSGAFEWGALAALGAAFSFAWSIVTVKELTKDHSALTILLYGNVLNALLLAVPAGLTWIAPTGEEWVLLAAMGVFGMIAQACYIKGIALADASVLAPMDYVRLPLAAGLGWLIFQEAPGWRTWVGALIVVGAALYITLREAQLARQKPPMPQG